MNILALESSTARGSVCALAGKDLVLNESFVSERGHSSDLFLNLERALSLLDRRCDRIAVGLGPGSYSGVRIAISAAIGLSFGTNAELVGIPSVLAIETDLTRHRTIGDARRETFYFAEVRERVLVQGPILLTAGELEAKLSDDACPTFTSALIPRFPQAQIAFPSARLIAELAASGHGITARDHLEPIYLRDPHITQPRK